MLKHDIYWFTARCLTVTFLFLLLPVISHSSQLIYTIQTGSYVGENDARNYYDSVVEKLNENELDYLRIEKIGKFYAVRLGTYNDHAAASAFLNANSHMLPGAVVMNAYIKDERIIKSYTSPLSADNENHKENLVSNVVPASMHSGMNKEADKNELAELINESPLKRVSFTERNFDSLSDEEASAPLDESIVAVTIPSADVTLSFIQPGQIAKVRIREGDLVKENQVLVQQDSAAEKEQLSMIRKESEDTTQIEAQQATLAQKREYLKSLEWAAKRGAATEAEMEDAKLEVRIAEFSLQTAKFNHEQSKRKYREAKIRLDHMSMKSPITGRVEKVEVEVGESIDGLTGAVRVVQTDPLWIDVHVPLETGKTLSLNQTAQVVFPGVEQNVMKGKIIFISTVADAASSTLRARIEVPNKSNRPAGQQVSVLFSNLNKKVVSDIAGEF
jgi:RND family efflux transporter MFP subunit